jgi:hypothetical protein
MELRSGGKEVLPANTHLTQRAAIGRYAPLFDWVLNEKFIPFRWLGGPTSRR